jgi:hypothetical protein
MVHVNEKRILNVKNKPDLKNGIELKSIGDLEKLINVGNLVCLYEDSKERVFFIKEFFYREAK